MRHTPLIAAALVLLAAGSGLHAAVLPEDRADVMYHRYDGGGVVVQGPSVLVRKSFGQSVSVSANYYVDMISSASIDVVTTASPYKERREQKSLSADYLRGKSLYSLGYIESEESDYTAKTASFNISQDMFGDLTTVSFGFARGWDDIGSREPTFHQSTDRRNYRLGVTQVLTRNMILALNYEGVSEEGYLQNPYRSLRYLTPDPNLYTTGPEIYPRTRTSNAASGRLRYYLPWRAAVDGKYRFYTDTWNIHAHTAELEYTQPLWKKWVFNGNYRFYKQNAADFYNDLFPRANFQNFIARDKEISTYIGHTIGLGASYEFKLASFSRLQKGRVNLHWDHLLINYDDFRDLTGTATPGTEPLYKLDADVFRLFLSIWF
ncbi:MAG: DUF3570 domain-containing protein [Steroidobacteraceae bacterium]